MKIINILIKSFLALIISFFLFISLPAIQTLLGRDLYKKESQSQLSPVLMQVETKKREKKKVQKLKPRRIKSHSGSSRSRSYELKFSPDLNVGSGDGVAVEEINLENVVFEEGEADVSAIPISRPPVPYPRRAKEAEIEGIVEIILLIDRKGRVASIDFIKVPHPMFKKPIMKAVREWKFKPAMNKGVPVMMRVKQTIEFNIDD